MSSGAGLQGSMLGEWTVDRAGVGNANTCKGENGRLATSGWRVAAETDWGSPGRLIKMVIRCSNQAVNEGRGVTFLILSRFLSRKLSRFCHDNRLPYLHCMQLLRAV